MEMRAAGDVEIGRDMTAALPPLAHVLRDSFLRSHCSACFSPLRSPPPPPPSAGVVYCSQACYADDYPLHASSGELTFFLRCHSPSAAASDEGDTSDLRAALRLLSAAKDAPSGGGSQRIAGLLTNRDKLLAESKQTEMLSKIQRNAKEMAAVRFANKSFSETSVSLASEEAALCAVMTNAVEVLDDKGRCIGIAVYVTGFSWINHSCSPNACYSFEVGPGSYAIAAKSSMMMPGMLVSSSGHNSPMDDLTTEYSGLGNEYGPRIRVRSIKPIKKGMEVTVAYTDLLQPKAVRQSELQSKYQFICNCPRCSSEPQIYVDQVLQNFHAVGGGFSTETDVVAGNQDVAIEMLTDAINDAVSGYLSDGDAESCCLKLEKLVTVKVVDGRLRSDTETYDQRSGYLQLHPLHYLSIEAHTVLASAYKVRGSLLSNSSEVVDKISSKRYSDLMRTSAAYSLLLAGTVHHLFCSESSLICSAATFWANAGEYLLNIARFLALDGDNRTCMCPLVNQTDGYSCLSHLSYSDFERISNGFLSCITRNFVREVWDSLRNGCPYLQGIQDPMDFSDLRTTPDSCYRITGNNFRRELQGSADNEKTAIFQLGVHCALYAQFLLSICYGEGSHRVSHIESILHSYEQA